MRITFRSDFMLSFAMACLLLGLMVTPLAWGENPSEQTGFLKVSTEPEGASIEVDSGQKGTTPVVLEVPVGARKVKLSKEGFLPHSEEVVVSADGVLRLQVKLSLSPLASIKTISEKRGKDGSEMVFVPGGKLLTEGGEGGSQKVSVKAFWIDKFEVTNAQYAKFLEETKHPKPAYWEDPAYNQSQQPVVGVRWEDAVAYARWVGKRLPSEVEWEKAARGPDGRIYPWGDTWSSDRCNSTGKQDGFEGPAPVGQFPSGASPYGVMDMVGNVWEWVGDEPAPDAPADSKDLRIGKGGSWANSSEQVKVTARARGDKTMADCILGFRCALDGD
jgi:formylglycine-generating enzyme required for sulfatase activity